MNKQEACALKFYGLTYSRIYLTIDKKIVGPSHKQVCAQFLRHNTLVSPLTPIRTQIVNSLRSIMWAGKFEQ